MIAHLLISFFFFWNGKLRLRGAGRLLSWAASWDPQLQSFTIRIPKIGETTVDFRDRSTFAWMRYLLGHQSSDEGQVSVIRRYLSPGSVFWDVGANIGLVSALVFVSHPEVRIVAIEPNPSLAKSLDRLFRNHEQVIVLNRALSNTDGEASFFIPDRSSFNGSLETSQNSRGEVVQVQVSRGDSLLDEVPRLSPPMLLKIDVEGHEPSVFAGLRQIICRHRPIIIFEHDHLTDEKIDQVTPEGYDRFSIHDHSGDLIPWIDRRWSHNSVLIPKETFPKPTPS
jgi:FkbM family methyltransferase